MSIKILSRFNKENEKGFTLIELMIVIAVVGILAGIAIQQFTVYRTRSLNSAAIADLRNAATAQEAYYVANEQYCSTVAPLTGTTYGLYISDKVVLSVTAATTSGYTMTAYNSSGNLTYTLSGPGGAITK